LIYYHYKKHIPLVLIDLTPLKHPEKSVIFQGTLLIPLSLRRRGGKNFREGASPPLLSTLPFFSEVLAKGV